MSETEKKAKRTAQPKVNPFAGMIEKIGKATTPLAALQNGNPAKEIDEPSKAASPADQTAAASQPPTAAPLADSPDIIEPAPFTSKPKQTRNKTAADKEEAEQRQDERRTQGRKGVKLPRLMISFTPSQYDFIKFLSGIEHRTASEIIGEMINREIENRPDVTETLTAFKSRQHE